jgi:hypothetical protein
MERSRCQAKGTGWGAAEDEMLDRGGGRLFKYEGRLHFQTIRGEKFSLQRITSTIHITL